MLPLYFDTNIGHAVGGDPPIEMVGTELELRSPSTPWHCNESQCYGFIIISFSGLRPYCFVCGYGGWSAT